MHPSTQHYPAMSALCTNNSIYQPNKLCVHRACVETIDCVYTYTSVQCTLKHHK